MCAALPGVDERPSFRLHSWTQAAAVASINALPTELWSPKLATSVEEADECAMCMEPFFEGVKVKVLRCKHYFHAKCIDEWFLHGQQDKSRTCPLCSANPIVSAG